MITSSEIRDALAALIKERAGLDLEVYFNQVLNAEHDYAWIQLRPERVDEGYDYFVRRLRIDIQVVLAPKTSIVKHTDLLDIADALDAATHGYVRVADRKITVNETAAHIFDNVLHYEFILEFADGIAATDEELAQYELGGELKQNISADEAVY